jgi:transcriptional regulator with XRE-family HTH domain
MTDKEWYRALGERLQVARRNLGISDEDAAAAFNVTIRTYRKWEAGGRPRSDRYEGAANFVRTYDLPTSFYSWFLASAVHHHRDLGFGWFVEDSA